MRPGIIPLLLLWLVVAASSVIASADVIEEYIYAEQRHVGVLTGTVLGDGEDEVYVKIIWVEPAVTGFNGWISSCRLSSWGFDPVGEVNVVIENIGCQSLDESTAAVLVAGRLEGVATEAGLFRGRVKAQVIYEDGSSDILILHLANPFLTPVTPTVSTKVIASRGTTLIQSGDVLPASMLIGESVDLEVTVSFYQNRITHYPEGGYELTLAILTETGTPLANKTITLTEDTPTAMVEQFTVIKYTSFVLINLYNTTYGNQTLWSSQYYVGSGEPVSITFSQPSIVFKEGKLYFTIFAIASGDYTQYRYRASMTGTAELSSGLTITIRDSTRLEFNNEGVAVIEALLTDATNQFVSVSNYDGRLVVSVQGSGFTDSAEFEFSRQSIGDTTSFVNMLTTMVLAVAVLGGTGGLIVSIIRRGDPQAEFFAAGMTAVATALFLPLLLIYAYYFTGNFGMPDVLGIPLQGLNGPGDAVESLLEVTRIRVEDAKSEMDAIAMGLATVSSFIKFVAGAGSLTAILSAFKDVGFIILLIFAVSALLVVVFYMFYVTVLIAVALSALYMMYTAIMTGITGNAEYTLRGATVYAQIILTLFVAAVLLGAIEYAEELAKESAWLTKYNPLYYIPAALLRVLITFALFRYVWTGMMNLVREFRAAIG